MFAYYNSVEQRGTRWRVVETRVKNLAVHYALLDDTRRDQFLKLFTWMVALQDLPIYIRVLLNLIRDGDAFSSDDRTFYRWQGLTRMLEVLEDAVREELL